MTNEHAIKVLLDEWKCIDRNDGINCDRQCEKCDLVMDSAILKDAYNTAIQALEKENIYDDKEHYVTISKALYDKLNIDYEALSQKPICPSAGVDCEDCPAYEPCEVEAAKLQQAYNKGFDDCRQAVFDAIEHEDKWLLAAKGHNGLTEIAFSGLKARVDALPPVTQKPGKWITLENRFDLGDRVKCSECGQVFVVGDDVSRKFCPSCGVRMESEE